MNKAKELVKLKKKAYKLWSEQGRSIGYCELCGIKYKEINSRGKPAILNFHHVIPREIKSLSFDLLNGVCLCAFCHKWSIKGPHRNGLVFSTWFINKYPDRYKYLLETWEKPVEYTIEYLQEIIKNLLKNKS